MLEELAYRIVVLSLLLVAFGLGGRLRRRADRVGSKIPRSADGPLIQGALAVSGFFYYGTLCAWIGYPPAVAWAQVPVPAALRWSGAPLAAVGISLALWALRELGRNVTPTAAPRSDASLVTSGPYRRVRHPLYSSMLLTIPGFALLARNALVLAGGVAVLLVLLLRVRREEKELFSRFGEKYRAYRDRTGALVPRRSGWFDPSSELDS